MTQNRTYQATHPWLTFTADLRKAPAKLWVMLGECQSKCDHIAGVPLRPATAVRLYRLYLAKGVLATSAIEGNTLTEEEVLQHLEGKLKLPPSKKYLVQEIDNVLTGCNRILDEIKEGNHPDLTPAAIKEMNRQVLNKLALAPEVVPGEIRQHSVVVARYRGAPQEDCGYLLDQLSQWLNGPDFKPPEGMTIVYAILKAVLAHLYIAWIHPFGDGNGRTARLLEFQMLIASGVPAPAAQLMSNHYNQTRTEYYRQLDQASRSGGDIVPFINYAAQGFLDGLREQINVIREQQWNDTWKNYVHEMFKDKVSVADQRRRHLILDLSEKKELVSYAKLIEISPRITIAYARKTNKTLSRDVKILLNMGLIRIEDTKSGAVGLMAHKELIHAFLSPRADQAKKNG